MAAGRCCRACPISASMARRCRAASSIIGVSQVATDPQVAQSWIEAEFHEHWTLSADELALLPGMADKCRLRVCQPAEVRLSRDRRDLERNCSGLMYQGTFTMTTRRSVL